MGCTGHGQARPAEPGWWGLGSRARSGVGRAGGGGPSRWGSSISVLCDLAPLRPRAQSTHTDLSPHPTPSAHSLPSADPRAASSANPQLGARCREREGLSTWPPPLGPQPHPSQHPHPHLQYRKPLSQDPGQRALGILPLPLQQPCPILVWMMGGDSRARAGVAGQVGGGSHPS